MGMSYSLISTWSFWQSLKPLKCPFISNPFSHSIEYLREALQNVIIVKQKRSIFEL